MQVCGTGLACAICFLTRATDVRVLCSFVRCGEPHSGRPLRKVVISQCGELVNPAEYSMPFLNMDEAQPKSSKTSGTGLSLPGGSTSTTDPEVSTADRDDVERRERAALEEKSVRKQQAKQKQRSRVK